MGQVQITKSVKVKAETVADVIAWVDSLDEGAEEFELSRPVNLEVEMSEGGDVEEDDTTEEDTSEEEEKEKPKGPQGPKAKTPPAGKV
jgi:hypothetical protein